MIDKKLLFIIFIALIIEYYLGFQMFLIVYRMQK